MKTFITTATALTAVFGVYVAAREADLELPFFLIVGVSAVVSFGKHAIEALGNLLNAVRYYGRNLQRIQDLEEAREKDKSRLQSVLNELDEARDAGIEEGKLQVLGTMFSRHLKKVPTLEGVVLGPGGPTFIATCWRDSIPPLWTRFVLEDSLTGAAKGVLEVGEHREDGTALLQPRELSDPAFWTELANRAAVDSAIPPNLRLKRYIFDLPRVFEDSPPLIPEEPSDGE